MSKVVINVKGLTKKINKKEILHNISFKIKEGDILGFIGPNGAGKTTTIKLLLGLYKLDKGNVIINGYSIKNNYVNAIKNIGAIIENPDMYQYMTGYENLNISAKIYNISEKRLKEVIDLVGLSSRIHDKVSKYSLGMKQRLGIAQAILHNPKLLILDEPTNGLDPEGIKDLKKLLIELSKKGMAIIVSSHILSELESFCTKILIIDKGTIISYNTIEEIKKITSTNNYLLEIDNINLNNILYNYQVIDNNHIKINTTKDKLITIIKTLIDNNINIFEIKKEVLSLEEIFLKLTKDNIND